MKKAVVCPNGPKAAGPYSVGMQAGNFLYVSGQIPMTPEGELVIGDVQEQTRQVMENIKAIVEAAGYTMADIVKANVYATSIADFPKINEIYARYFDKEPPARAFVEVSALALGVPVEIEAIAYKE
ncbi:MAG: reactive intermediate/imine deaminase [Synergistales bacterium]|nr:reactive intermediate/imine deaminase [Synergistales bacterium]